MGFLSKLKEIFKKEEEKEETPSKSISLDELDDFIDKKRKELNSILKEKEAPWISITKENLSELKKATSDLKDYTLEDRKERERIKDIVIQSKENLVKYNYDLVEKIEAELENDLTVDEKIQNIFDHIKAFNAVSHKSYMKATFLIGKQINEINKIMKNIRENSNNVLDSNKEEIEKKKTLSEIKKIFSDYKINRDYINQEKSKLNYLEKEKSSLSERYSHIEKELNKAKNSDEYKKHENLITEKQNLNVEFERINRDINTGIDRKVLDFAIHSGLDKAQKELASAYLMDPINTLEKDNNIEIYGILEKAKQNLEKDGSIDEKKKKRMLAKIIKSKSDFKKLQEKIENTKKKYSEISQEIKDIESSLDIEKKSKDLKNAKEELEEKSTTIKEETEKLDDLSEKNKEKFDKIKKDLKFEFNLSIS